MAGLYRPEQRHGEVKEVGWSQWKPVEQKKELVRFCSQPETINTERLTESLLKIRMPGSNGRGDFVSSFGPIKLLTLTDGHGFLAVWDRLQ